MFGIGKSASEQDIIAKGIAERRRYRAGFPTVPLTERNTRGGRLLPDRMALLDVMPKGGVVAEVGVANGDFSAQILARTQPAVLHLVDAWHTPRYEAGRGFVENRFAGEIAAGKVVLSQGLSTQMLPQFAPATFDWVYIDTNHNYATTAEELVLSARALKPGGKIAGHDYAIGNPIKPVVYGVVQAVHEFCVRDGWGFDYVALDSDGLFSFCLSKLD